MSGSWYYVEGSQRVGPVPYETFGELIIDGKIEPDTYVWVKGYENWVKAKTVDDLTNFFLIDGSTSTKDPEPPPGVPEKELDFEDLKHEIKWDEFSDDDRIFIIKIGMDRGGNPQEYGPFDLNTLKKAASEGRINDKTYLFVKGMETWTFIGDLPIFEKLFPGQTPDIKDEDRRSAPRRPFIARMFFSDETQVFIGVCRDISLGGLQVLIPGFEGTIGETISFNVHPENNDLSFVASGTIARVLEGGQGFSVRFSSLNNDAKSAIQNYLEDV